MDWTLAYYLFSLVKVNIFYSTDNTPHKLTPSILQSSVHEMLNKKTCTDECLLNKKSKQLSLYKDMCIMFIVWRILVLWFYVFCLPFVCFTLFLMGILWQQVTICLQSIETGTSRFQKSKPMKCTNNSLNNHELQSKVMLQTPNNCYFAA